MGATCPNKNSKQWKNMVEKLGETQALFHYAKNGFQILNEDQINEILNPVESQFNENSKLTNELYESLGLNQLITPNDRIVFGHPTIGKSFLKNQGEDKFISLDDDYATEINDKVKKIADKYNITTYQVKDGGTQKWNNEYNQMMQKMFDVAKQRAISENKTLFTSNTNLLRNNIDSFDKVINLTNEEFEKRIRERGAKYDVKEWKNQINEVITRFPSNKVINTTKYLSDLFITPEQIQQAQNKSKEFIDKVKDNTPNDILFSMSSGASETEAKKADIERRRQEELDVFPESEVKETVFHNTTENFDEFKVGKDGAIHFGDKEAARQRTKNSLGDKNTKEVKINVKNLVEGVDSLAFDKPEGTKEEKEIIFKLIQKADNETKEHIVALYVAGKITLEQANELIDNNWSLEKIYKELFNADGYYYINQAENKGSKSYVVFNPNQVKIVNKINAKYDAELKALEQPTQSESNPALSDVERTDKDFVNENESYRVIVGDEAFNDIVNSGVVRTNADNKGTNKQEGIIDLGGRPTAFPSFSKGSASMSYAKDNPNHYIIVTEDASIQPSTSGRHGKGNTMFPTDENGKHLKELDGSKVKVYKYIGNGKYELVYANGKVVKPLLSSKKTNTNSTISVKKQLDTLINRLNQVLNIPINTINDLQNNTTITNENGNVTINLANIKLNDSLTELLTIPTIEYLKQSDVKLYNSIKNELNKSKRGTQLLNELKESNPELTEDNITDLALSKYLSELVETKLISKNNVFKKLYNKILEIINKLFNTNYNYIPNLNEISNDLNSYINNVETDFNTNLNEFLKAFFNTTIENNELVVLNDSPIVENPIAKEGRKVLKKAFGENAMKEISKYTPSAVLNANEFISFINNEILLDSDHAKEFLKLPNALVRVNPLFENYLGIEHEATSLSPFDLVSKANYKLHEVKDVDDLLFFKEDYKHGYTICTFNDGTGESRLNKSYIFWIRKDYASDILPYHLLTKEYLNTKSKDAEEWRNYLRKKGNINSVTGEYILPDSPATDDPYILSSISVQFDRNSGFQKMVGRYNHVIDSFGGSADATLNNNLDNVIEGLTDAMKKYLDIQIEVKPVVGTVEVDNKFFVYNNFISEYNTYISTSSILDEGKLTKINKDQQLITNSGLLFDFKHKRIGLFNINHGPDFNKLIKDKNVIIAYLNDDEFIKFTLDDNNKFNKIKSIESNVTAIDFYYSKIFNSIETLDEVSFPNLKESNNLFNELRYVDKFNFNSLEHISNSFNSLRGNSDISLPNLKELILSFVRFEKTLTLDSIENINSNFKSSYINLKLNTNLKLDNLLKMANGLTNVTYSLYDFLEKHINIQEIIDKKYNFNFLSGSVLLNGVEIGTYKYGEEEYDYYTYVTFNDNFFNRTDSIEIMSTLNSDMIAITNLPDNLPIPSQQAMILNKFMEFIDSNPDYTISDLDKFLQVEYDFKSELNNLYPEIYDDVIKFMESDYYNELVDEGIITIINGNPVIDELISSYNMSKLYSSSLSNTTVDSSGNTVAVDNNIKVTLKNNQLYTSYTLVDESLFNRKGLLKASTDKTYIDSININQTNKLIDDFNSFYRNSTEKVNKRLNLIKLSIRELDNKLIKTRLKDGTYDPKIKTEYDIKVSALRKEEDYLLEFMSSHGIGLESLMNRMKNSSGVVYEEISEVDPFGNTNTKYLPDTRILNEIDRLKAVVIAMNENNTYLSYLLDDNINGVKKDAESIAMHLTMATDLIESNIKLYNDVQDVLNTIRTNPNKTAYIDDILTKLGNINEITNVAKSKIKEKTNLFLVDIFNQTLNLNDDDVTARVNVYMKNIYKDSDWFGNFYSMGDQYVPDYAHGQVLRAITDSLLTKKIQLAEEDINEVQNLLINIRGKYSNFDPNNLLKKDSLGNKTTIRLSKYNNKFIEAVYAGKKLLRLQNDYGSIKKLEFMENYMTKDDYNAFLAMISNFTALQDLLINPATGFKNLSLFDLSTSKSSEIPSKDKLKYLNKLNNLTAKYPELNKSGSELNQLLIELQDAINTNRTDKILDIVSKLLMPKLNGNKIDQKSLMGIDDLLTMFVNPIPYTGNKIDYTSYHTEEFTNLLNSYPNSKSDIIDYYDKTNAMWDYINLVADNSYKNIMSRSILTRDNTYFNKGVIKSIMYSNKSTLAKLKDFFDSMYNALFKKDQIISEITDVVDNKNKINKGSLSRLSSLIRSKKSDINRVISAYELDNVQFKYTSDRLVFSNNGNIIFYYDLKNNKLFDSLGKEGKLSIKVDNPMHNFVNYMYNLPSHVFTDLASNLNDNDTYYSIKKLTTMLAQLEVQRSEIIDYHLLLDQFYREATAYKLTSDAESIVKLVSENYKEKENSSDERLFKKLKQLYANNQDYKQIQKEINETVDATIKLDTKNDSKRNLSSEYFDRQLTRSIYGDANQDSYYKLKKIDNSKERAVLLQKYKEIVNDINSKGIIDLQYYEFDPAKSFSKTLIDSFFNNVKSDLLIGIVKTSSTTTARIPTDKIVDSDVIISKLNKLKSLSYELYNLDNQYEGLNKGALLRWFKNTFIVEAFLGLAPIAAMNNMVAGMTSGIQRINNNIISTEGSVRARNALMNPLNKKGNLIRKFALKYDLITDGIDGDTKIARKYKSLSGSKLTAKAENFKDEYLTVMVFQQKAEMMIQGVIVGGFLHDYRIDGIDDIPLLDLIDYDPVTDKITSKKGIDTNYISLVDNFLNDTSEGSPLNLFLSKLKFSRDEFEGNYDNTSGGMAIKDNAFGNLMMSMSSWIPNKVKLWMSGERIDYLNKEVKQGIIPSVINSGKGKAVLPLLILPFLSVAGTVGIGAIAMTPLMIGSVLSVSLFGGLVAGGVSLNNVKYKLNLALAFLQSSLNTLSVLSPYSKATFNINATKTLIDNIETNDKEHSDDSIQIAKAQMMLFTNIQTSLGLVAAQLIFFLMVKGLLFDDDDDDDDEKTKTKKMLAVVLLNSLNKVSTEEFSALNVLQFSTRQAGSEIAIGQMEKLVDVAKQTVNLGLYLTDQIDDYDFRVKSGDNEGITHFERAVMNAIPNGTAGYVNNILFKAIDKKSKRDFEVMDFLPLKINQSYKDIEKIEDSWYYSLLGDPKVSRKGQRKRDKFNRKYE